MRRIWLLTAIVVTMLAPSSRAQLGSGVGIRLLGHVDRNTPDDLYTDVWVSPHPDGRLYAYCGTWGDGLHVFDVTNPTAPTLVTKLVRPGGEAQGYLDMKTNPAGDVLYSVVTNTGTWIVDVRDHLAPAELALIPRGGQNFHHNLWADGDLLYIASLGFGIDPTPLEIFDVSDPTSPRPLGLWDTGGDSIHDVVVLDDVAYIAGLQSGLFLVDVSDPSNPTTLGNGAYDLGCAPSVTHNAWPTQDRSHVLVTDEICGDASCTVNGDLRVFDVQDLANIVEVGSYEATPNYNLTVHNVMVFGDYAYVSWYARGIRVLDVSTPASPVEVASLETYETGGGCFPGAWGVYTDGCGLVYGLDRVTGLWIFRADSVPACNPAPYLKPGSLTLVDACDVNPSSPGAGDGAADPGERVELVLALDNRGDAAASGVTAVLASADPRVTVLADTASYASVPATSQVGPDTTGFVVQLATAGFECAESISLQLTLTTATATSGPHPLTLPIGSSQPVLFDDFEADAGWTALSSDPTAGGQWQRGVPDLSNFQPGAGDPRDAGQSCAATGLAAATDDSDDVDAALVSWQSPPLDLSAFEAATVRYSRWFAGTSADDFFRGEWWPGGGLAPSALEVVQPNVFAWNDSESTLRDDDLSAGARLRFTAFGPDDVTITEAAVDRVDVRGWTCAPCLGPSDVEVGVATAVGECGDPGQPEPGETVELRIPLRNTGAAPLTSVTATVVGADPAVAVRRATASYPDIAPGATESPAPAEGPIIALGAGLGCTASVGLDLEVTTAAGSSLHRIDLSLLGSPAADVFRDGFDADPAGVVPTGWTASSDFSPPDAVRIETRDRVEPVAFAAPASPPNAVHLGRDGGCCPADPFLFSLSRSFDLSPWAGRGLEVRVRAWFLDLEGSDDFRIVASDGITTATIAGGYTDIDSFRDGLGLWQDVAARLDGHGLDFSRPVTIDLVGAHNYGELSPLGFADLIYVDDFAIVEACGCAQGDGLMLFRSDVADLSSYDKATVFRAPTAAGVSLDVPYYFLGFTPGLDPRDPAVLDNGVPLVLYQVGGEGVPEPVVKVVKSGRSVAISF